MRARLLVSLAIGLPSVFSRSIARAEEPVPRERPAFVFRPAVDIPIMALSAGIATTWLFRNDFAPPSCAPACDRAQVPKLDRFAAGRYDATVRTVSDVSVFTLLGGGVVTLLVDEGGSSGSVDSLIVGEAVLASNALATSLMWATRRARPFSYGNVAPLEKRLEGNASMSFFSGHTTASFAAAVGVHRALLLKHPKSAGPWVALGVGLAVASFVGTTRVLAGDHFPTDVLAGAAAGSALGYLVPKAHEWKVRPVVDGSGISIVGVF